MTKYKDYSYDQGVFLPVFFDKQILPGTFEYSLNHLIDNEVDLTVFDKRYNNDETGAPAYDPRILLKIVLFAYSRGITSSRKIAQCCEENIIFMALSALFITWIFDIGLKLIYSYNFKQYQNKQSSIIKTNIKGDLHGIKKTYAYLLLYLRMFSILNNHHGQRTFT